MPVHNAPENYRILNAVGRHLPLLKLPDLHWLWIRLLVGCRSGRFAMVLLRALGISRWILFPRHRRRINERYRRLADVARNAGLRGALTETPPAKLTRQYFISRAILGAAPAIVASASPAFIRTFVSCDTIEAIEAEAASEHGMVIVGTHFGSLGISPALLAARGHHVIILRDQRFARLVDSRHGPQFFLGAQPVFLDSHNPDSVNKALLKCSRALRGGAIIGYTADAQHGSRSVTGKVFGREVPVRTALVELAARCGSAVVNGFGYVADGRVKVWLSDPVRLGSSTELEEWCSRFCTDWEKMILEHPEGISWHRTDLDLIVPGDD